MNFNVYHGALSSNASVDITCFGSFEAKDKTEALSIIKTNKEHRYCEKWQFPFKLKDKYVSALHSYFKFGLFVCEGDPILSNLIWKDINAVINFFDKPKKGV